MTVKRTLGVSIPTVTTEPLTPNVPTPPAPERSPMNQDLWTVSAEAVGAAVNDQLVESCEALLAVLRKGEFPTTYTFPASEAVLTLRQHAELVTGVAVAAVDYMTTKATTPEAINGGFDYLNARDIRVLPPRKGG